MESSPQTANLIRLLEAALELARRSGGQTSIAKIGAALERLRAPAARLLISGLCSVGKSSFVSALWGDADVLPTAVRDCTQTNTLVRVPAANENDRQILLSYLTREQALDFATRDLSYYRLQEFLSDADALTAGQLSELLPEEKLRKTVAAVRQLFQKRHDLLVLNEHLTDELDKLDEFLKFLDSAEFKSGATVTADWSARRELLMGRRGPDGRTFDVGKLLALRHVEIVRATNVWRVSPPPQLIDTPWIPTFYNARRADLILAQARGADLLIALALPDRFEPEPWLADLLRADPALGRRTLVVYNQIDTVNTATLFARDGFAEIFDRNAERLDKLKIPRENVFMSCARLPFLRLSPQDELVTSRIARLESVLGKINKIAAERPASPFTRSLLAATDPKDAGIETLRARIEQFSQTIVRLLRTGDALAAVSAAHDESAPGAPPEIAAEWAALQNVWRDF